MTANILRAPKRRRAVVVILAIAVASVRASSQQIDSTSRASAKQMMLAAQRALLRDGNPAAAKAGFQTAIRQDSTFAAPRFNLGVLAEAQGNWREARDWFREYLRVAPASSSADLARAELLVLERRLAAQGDSAASRRAEYAAHIELSRRLVKAGVYTDAIAEAEAARHVDGSAWDSYALGATALMGLHRPQPALALLDSAAARAPDSVRSQLDQLRRLIASAHH